MAFETKPCPYCNFSCEADWVDVGVGYVQCGPFHCTKCGASEIGPYDKPRDLSPEEIHHRWYAPGSTPGSSANVVNGKIVSHHQAKAIYRSLWPFSATEAGAESIRAKGRGGCVMKGFIYLDDCRTLLNINGISSVFDHPEGGCNIWLLSTNSYPGQQPYMQTTKTLAEIISLIEAAS